MLLGIALEFICKLGRRKMEERKTTRGLVFFGCHGEHLIPSSIPPMACELPLLWCQ
jgi:hypothetical protein